jgi:hypothetical protein
MTMRTTLAALAAAALCGPAHAEPTVEPTAPPAAPAPAARPGDADALSVQLDRLADARRDVLAAERELREANAAVARARGSSTRLARAEARQREAQEAFDAARGRVPELVAEARAAGLSAAAVRSYEHSLYGD